MSGLHVRVRGQVQGVGFRPFVWQLAQRFGVSGSVANDAEGVWIAAQGGDLDGFLHALRAEAPPLARVEMVEVTPGEVSPDGGFVIARSGAEGADTRVTPDAATCAACLDEIRGGGRRRGYAFTNCTHCGPRFTILQGLPYDRARTTMAPFAMCPACQAEYDDPGDRRFHAQPVACPACGPRLWLEVDGAEVAGDAIALAAARLSGGGIVAIKGLGGFHLACDATDAAAIARLRTRKRRPAKPLALMGTLAMVRAVCRVSDAEAAQLRDAASPIVLLDRSGDGLPDILAPGMDRLGWMLPYTPLHHLLVDAVNRPLVMTSGNLSGQPQAIDNDAARRDLAGFADAFLMQDRAIARRLDDSVLRVTSRGPMVLRRARGLVPGTLPLPDGFGDAPPVIAYGGQMKGAVCLTKSGQALLGHHLGDLTDPLSVAAFDQACADYAALFDHRPQLAACDLHPDFHATRTAEASGLPVVAVQHHHAHLASCLGETGWPRDGGPVAGIVLDGLGLGPDGTIWGGEVLLGDYAGFQRIAHLAPAPLIGGDRAQAEPWRNLLVRLDAAGLCDLADRLLAAHPLTLARQAARAGLNAPPSSSAGRLFDAMAAALGLCVDRQTHEGEAAMRLEALARCAPANAGTYPMDIRDPAPLFRAVAGDLTRGTDRAVIARRCHDAVARAFAAPARTLVEGGAARAVALTGGCFQNTLLQDLTLAALDGLPVLTHGQVPANDGGLALGQALVAAASL